MRIQDLEQTPRAAVALATDYVDGTFLPMHKHQRGQFLYSISGLMQVKTVAGQWLVLPNNGVWIPKDSWHSVRMDNASTRSVYVDEGLFTMPLACQVLTVSPLLHLLLLDAAKVPLLYDEDGRDGALMTLLMHEVCLAKPMDLYMPMPEDASLAKLCADFMREPNIHVLADEWAVALHKSPRTFARFFMAQLGMGFGQWRHQVCLHHALLKMAAGQQITQIALSLGYESLGAFSAMFRKAMGQSPKSMMNDWSKSP